MKHLSHSLNENTLTVETNVRLNYWGQSTKLQFIYLIYNIFFILFYFRHFCAFIWYSNAGRDSRGITCSKWLNRRPTALCCIFLCNIEIGGRGVCCSVHPLQFYQLHGSVIWNCFSAPFIRQKQASDSNLFLPDTNRKLILSLQVFSGSPGQCEQLSLL